MEKHNRPVQGTPNEKNEDVQMFREITEYMLDTYRRKNNDYGNSVEEIHNEFGDVSLIVRLADKYNRVKNLIKRGTPQLVSESIYDTLIDLANYAIIAVILMRKKQNESMAKDEF